MKISASEYPTIQFTNVVRSEFTKIISHPTIGVFIFITTIVNLGLALLDASGLTFYTGEDLTPSTVSDFGVLMFAPIYAFLILPVYAASYEYQGGQYRMTLVAITNRWILTSTTFHFNHDSNIYCDRHLTMARRITIPARPSKYELTRNPCL